MNIFSKKEGSAGAFNLLPVMLTIFLGAVILINFSVQIRYLSLVNKIENLAGKYMLIMETENGLTLDDRNRLNAELNSIGINIKDIDYTGTTFYDDRISYGDEIYLRMKIGIPYSRVNVEKDMNVELKTDKRQVIIEKCALALG